MGGFGIGLSCLGEVVFVGGYLIVAFALGAWIMIAVPLGLAAIVALWAVVTGTIEERDLMARATAAREAEGRRGTDHTTGPVR